MSKNLFRVIVGVFCLIWLAKNAIGPSAAFVFFYNDYLQLSSQCADAMDESWFLEQKESPALDKTAQIHLLACHEYDKTRKIMLSMGVPESALAYIGLKALEINQKSAEKFVEQHRFQQR
ncbi:MAG: TIGR03982 family His-Xaa-Ser system protein [Pseudomonadales bacterium]